MGIATEMKELTRNIASSHRDRRRKVGEIREEVNQARGEAQSLIMGFEAFRQETNRQLRQDLARDKARRKSETAGILREAQNILQSFEASRKEANAQLREALSRSTAERQDEVRKTLGDAQKLIKGFSTSRQNVSSKLRKDLSRSRVKSKSEVGKLLGNARSLVRGFQTSRREAGSQLRKELAQSQTDRESDVKRMQSDFRKAQGNVKADLKEARVAWQGLAGTGQAKKGWTGIPSKAEAPAAKEETPDLETKVLAAVDNHPKGITLAGVADSLGVAPVVLGRASKSLLDKGKIRKNEKLYFPAASE
jgi:hypothetical protein